MDEFMKAYTIKEVSKQIGVPEGTLRQWEQDFEGVLHIPRDENNARFYTDLEINTLEHIKTMRDKRLSKPMIRELLEKRKEGGEDSPKMLQPSVPQMKQSEVVQSLQNIQNLPEEFKNMFAAMVAEYKEELKKEVREEIREEVKNSLIPEIQKQIANDSERQQKLLELGQKDTSEQLETLSKDLEKMEKNYQGEVARRDKLLMEHMQLMKEQREEREERQKKEEKNKGFFKKFFS